MVERTVVDQRANCSRRGVIMLVDSWSVVGVEVVDEDGVPGVQCGLVEFNGRYRTTYSDSSSAHTTRHVLGSSHVFGQLFDLAPLESLGLMLTAAN